MSDQNPFDGDSDIECRFSNNCFKHLEAKMDAMHANLNGAAKYIKHLEKLDSLDDIKEHLMSAATGRDQIETKTAILIFKILGLVIATLLITIVFLLTGQHFNLLDLVSNK